jgi:aspartate carbamoyltransferase catalytic subunit
VRNLLSARDLDRVTLDRILAGAADVGLGASGSPLDGRVIGLLFYTDSLRTRVGFEVAAAHLGARTVGVSGGRYTPVMSEPESVFDAVRSIAGWCDAICLRHPDPAAITALAAMVDVPLINCGNGTDEHPTQSLIDLFAISDQVGSIDNVRLAMVGDLDGMRSAHSLLIALGRYRDVFVRCISPPGLEMPEEYLAGFSANGNRVEHSHRAEYADVDVIYVAGLPRHAKVDVSQDSREALAITSDTLATLSAHTRILCPLPRIDEIRPDVDDTAHASYFRQSELGLAVRMAVLMEILS